jgi:sugar/nucleoside kinase (ribokinase family)
MRTNRPILFVGTSTLDHLALVDQIPERDQRVKARSMLTCGGGPAATAAVAARTLGAPCHLVSAVGDDPAGSHILEEFRGCDIPTDGIQIIEGGHSSVSLIHVESNGLRTITAFGGVIEQYDLGRFPARLVEQSAIVHADGNHPPLTLEAFRTAKRHGVITSLDGGNMSEQALADLLPLTDIFITDAKSLPAELKHRGHEEACRLLAESGPECVVITNGKEGCVMRTSDGVFIERGIPVQVVDTTGAGDNFHGAFVFGVWKGLSMTETLKLANAFAAVSCEGLGGRGRLVSYDYIRERYL